MLKIDAEDVGSLQGDNPEDMLRCAYKENEEFLALLLLTINSHLEKSLMLLDSCKPETLLNNSTSSLLLHFYRCMLFKTKQELLTGVTRVSPKTLNGILKTEDQDVFRYTDKKRLNEWANVMQDILFN